jgi:amino acid transporter
MGAVGMALFAFNGYGGAVLLAEDMKDGGRTVHRAVLWSLVVVVAIEVIPLAALLIGAPSLEAMLASGDPIGYLLTAHGNETLARLVSAGSSCRCSTPSSPSSSRLAGWCTAAAAMPSGHRPSTAPSP